MAWSDDVFLTFANRWVHVLAMVFILGGSAFLSGLALRRKCAAGSEFDRVLVLAAKGYEKVFWLALGLLILTGMGNAGAFAGHLPDRLTIWGQRFVTKLFVVLLLMMASLFRTSFIGSLATNQDMNLSPAARRGVLVSYVGTSLFVAIIFTLALRLAHG